MLASKADINAISSNRGALFLKYPLLASLIISNAIKATKDSEAKKYAEDEFTFKGETYFTSYAKYVIEFYRSRFDE